MSGNQILIVDHDRATRMALSGTLAAYGHDCKALENERGLLDLLRTREYGLLLVDPMLPMLDLGALMETLAAEAIETATLALVAAGENDASWEKVLPRLAGVVEKPDGGAYLGEIVHKALDRRAARGAQACDARTNDQYEALFSASPDLIVVMDKDRRVLRCNPRLTKLLGLTEEKLAGLEIHEALCGDGHKLQDCPLGRALDEARKDPAPQRRGLWGKNYDLHSAPLLDGSGRLWGAIDILHDVTSLVQAEQAVLRRLEVERLATNISSKFVEGLDVNEGIEHALARIGAWSQASRAHLFQFDDEAKYVAKTHEWCAPGIDPSKDRNESVPAGRYLWLLAQLCDNKTIHIEDLSKLPDEARPERLSFEVQSTQSLAAFPVQVGDRVAGFIRLDNVHTTHEWREEDSLILRMVAEIVGNALERHRAELQHKLLATAIDQLSEMIMVTGPDHRIQYVNPAFEQMTGFTARKSVGKHPFDLFGDDWSDPAEKTALIEQIESGEVWRGRSVSRRADGQHYERDNTICPVIEKGGKIGHWVMIGRDVTEQARLEAQLHQAQRMESIGQLAAGIAHEINTPIQYVGDNTRFLKDSFGELAAIVEAFRRLMSDGEKGEIPAESLAAAHAAAAKADMEYLMTEIPQAIDQSLEGLRRVTRIVRAMKEFSHPGGKEMKTIDLARAIESTVEVSRNEWKYVAKLELSLAENIPPLLGFPGQLNQALLNIIVNAAHAIGDVVGKSGEKGTIRISTRQEGEEAVIEISDTGAGIPEEIRGKIFDPFFTTKEVGKGTGQGLAIVYSVVVEKHRGKVSFETETGRGTKFFVRLPLAGAPAEPTEAPPKTAARAAAGATA